MHFLFGYAVHLFHQHFIKNFHLCKISFFFKEYKIIKVDCKTVKKNKIEKFPSHVKIKGMQTALLVVVVRLLKNNLFIV